MSRNILDYYAERNTPFLHGAGQKGTAHLLSILELKGTEKVLEVGFGTGATQVQLKSRFPNLDLYGIEQSSAMYHKAKNRMAWALLSSSQLYLKKDQEAYPFADNHFDVIYLESVLGILSLKEIKSLLREVHRVLKKGGIFAINETMWLKTISGEERDKINQRCLEAYGIIQAQSTIATIEEWESFLAQNGFIVEYRAAAEGPYYFSSTKMSAYLSALFSLAGKAVNFFNPQHISEAKRIKELSTQLFKKDQAYLNAYILKMRKG